MSLSHRVTEILENLNDKVNSWFSTGVKTRNKMSNTLGTDLVITVTTSSTLLADANADRLSIYIENDGTTPVIVKLGGAASISSRNYILNAASGVRTGDGGTMTIENWYGSIYAIVETGTVEVTVTEIESEL